MNLRHPTTLIPPLWFKFMAPLEVNITLANFLQFKILWAARQCRTLRVAFLHVGPAVCAAPAPALQHWHCYDTPMYLIQPKRMGLVNRLPPPSPCSHPRRRPLPAPASRADGFRKAGRIKGEVSFRSEGWSLIVKIRGNGENVILQWEDSELLKRRGRSNWANGAEYPPLWASVNCFSSDGERESE